VNGRWRGTPERGLYAFDPEGAAGSVSTRSAAFLDRDGTLNAGAPDPASGLIESPLRTEDVRLLPGAADAARRLALHGFSLVCVSNQPAAAKGTTTIGQLLAVHERVLELLAAEGVQMRTSRLCLHHPEALVESLRGPCECRKPAPGMLVDAADSLGLEMSSSWMIGDTDADVLAGQAAGCATMLVEYPGSAHKRSGVRAADLVASDLADGATKLLRSHRG
jgi:D-glycero-D-manno-heptose 1,7-bisphosphate phosphatase